MHVHVHNDRVHITKGGRLCKGAALQKIHRHREKELIHGDATAQTPFSANNNLERLRDSLANLQITNRSGQKKYVHF